MHFARWGLGKFCGKFDDAREFMLRQALPREVLQFLDEGIGIGPGDFSRQLWIVRLNAACRPLGISYSRLISGLKKANITMDRKNLSELAIHDAPAFEAIVKKAQAALV